MTDYLHIQLPPDQIRGISSIGLAHMGDAVYELLVRTWLCAHGKATGKGLHRATVALVCAPKQAELAQRILLELKDKLGGAAPAEGGISAGAATLTSTPFPPMPAVRSTSRPRRWKRCWAGCTSAAATTGWSSCSP